MKEILLLGAGAANLQVLEAAAREPFVAARITLVSPYAAGVHGPCVPEVVAGVLASGAAVYSVAALARRAHAQFIEAAATGLDPAQRRVTLDDGRTLHYDVLSLDMGGTPARDSLPGARMHGLFVRPYERFLPLWEGVESLAERHAVNIVVVGASLEACTLTLAMARRLGRRGRFTLVGGDAGLMPGERAAVRRKVARQLVRQGITVLQDVAVDVSDSHVRVASGARLASDVAVILQGLVPPAWLVGSGLALDETGRVRVGATLRSLSHPEVFACGALATRDGMLTGGTLPALASGPTLALNLRRAAGGGQVVRQPRRRAPVRLVTCGARRALWIGPGFTILGRLAWWVKQRSDAAALARLRVPMQETLPAKTRPAALTPAANDAALEPRALRPVRDGRAGATRVKDRSG